MPDQAVVRSTQGAFVYLVKDGVVRIMPVKLLGMANGKAAISGELARRSASGRGPGEQTPHPFGREQGHLGGGRQAGRCPRSDRSQEMRFVERYIRRPHLVLSLVLLLSVVGVMGYTKMPFNLFPDVDRPQISVVTVMPGAAAGDVEADITRMIEKELSTIDMVRKVTSTSKDEASVVTAEFEYEKGLDAAATDVANALSKVASAAPAGDQAPPGLQDQPGHPAGHDPGPLPGARLTCRPAQSAGTGRQPDQGRVAAQPGNRQRRGLRRLSARDPGNRRPGPPEPLRGGPARHHGGGGGPEPEHPPGDGDQPRWAVPLQDRGIGQEGPESWQTW